METTVGRNLSFHHRDASPAFSGLHRRLLVKGHDKHSLQPGLWRGRGLFNGVQSHGWYPQYHRIHEGLCCSARDDRHLESEVVGPSSSVEGSRPGSAWWQMAMTTLTGSALLCSIFFAPVGQVAEARTRLTAEERETTDIFRKSRASVVYITNLAVKRDAFTMDLMEIPQGAGSGFVYDMDGHIITNYHVIKGANDLQVTLTGEDEYKAKVIGFDQDKDIAVLKIDVPEEERRKVLQPLKFGDSSDLLVGQRVYAIGNPFGLDHTLTMGVISGTGREINSGNTGRPIEDVIQTDAAINPGNSGGPLLDSGGALIGINTAIYSPSGANSGVGFAIPVDVVKSSVSQIIQFGKVIRPILGIQFAPDQTEQLGVTGILVLDAKAGGPAYKAGINGTKRDEFGRLVLGDIITGFNNQKVKNASDLYKLLDRCKIGEAVEIEVLRGNSKEKVSVTLGSSDQLA